jgi:amino acid adenylation domain-containing protein
MGDQQNAGFWLSPQQKRLWLIEKDFRPLRAVTLALLDRPIDPEKFRHAAANLVARHEILRTVFRSMPGMKVPFQVVLDQAEIDCAVPEVAYEVTLDDLFQQERSRSIDLEHGPVLHLRLAQLIGGRSAILLGLPAMMADSQSLQLLLSELLSEASPSSEEPLRYVQFAQWQNDVLESDDEDANQAQKFWNRIEPESLTAPVLPMEHAGAGSAEFESFSAKLDTDTCSAVRTLAERQNTSPSTVLLSAWQTLIWRLTGETGFVTGVYSDGREFEELRGAVGLFGKTLPLRARFDSDYSFEEIVRYAGEKLQEMSEWQPYYTPGHGFANEPLVGYEYQDLSAAPAIILRQEIWQDSFKLKLTAQQKKDSLELHFQFDSSRLPRAAVERWSGHLEVLLAAAAANPTALASGLPLLTASEVIQFSEWNATAADYPRDQCIHQLFESQAALHPDRLALRCGDRALSYRELNQEANRLAHALRRMGVPPDSTVGLCVDRSVEMIVGVLAILKSGGAYVPLSSDHPKARLSQQLSGAKVLITEATFLEQMPEFCGPILCIDKDRSRWANESDANPQLTTNPENLAYVIFTSGSTGVPKGVAVRHRNLVNYSCFIAERLEVEKHPEGLAFATVSTLAADLGNTCVFGSLVSGGCLHVITHDDATNGERMAALNKRHPIDVIKIAPSHLAALLESAERKNVLPRKWLVTGGEALTPRLLDTIRACAPSCEFLNHYGPTETTVGCLTLRLRDFDWSTSPTATAPLGRPIANTRAYILDAQQQRVPVGVAGELYIAGDGVTAGYIGQPERTAERFLPEVFSADPASKMYRTGDLARFLPDGNIEFLGRADDQVKIRGFRIELGEIESAVAQHSAVKQALVIAREDASGDRKLVAYFVAKPGQEVSVSDFRNFVKDKLPPYMVPSAFVKIASIPLNANGKVNRAALPDPETAATKREKLQGPRDRFEEIVWKSWTTVLGTQSIDIRDNFFDLGGHSLLAVRVLHAIKEETGKEISPAALFQGATVEDLAKILREEEPAIPKNELLTAVQTEGSRMPLFAAVEPGVSAIGYILLSKHLGNDQPFYKLQSQGEKMRWRPYCDDEYDTLADQYIQAMRSVQPKGPYHIVGMCEAAFIAYKMVQKLEAAGEKVGLLGCFDTWVRENTRRRKVRWMLVKYYAAKRKLRRLFKGTPEFQTTTLPAAPGAECKAIPMARVDDWNQAYWPGKDFVDPKIQAKISVFRSPKQPIIYIQDRTLAWDRRTTGGTDVYMIQGGHFKMLREPAVRTLAERLRHALSLVNPEQPPKDARTADEARGVAVGS